MEKGTIIMSRNRFIILAAAMIMWISLLGSAAGIRVQAARSENADKKAYTSNELGCMAQYYYKRTSKEGLCPAEVVCEEQKDGTYLITLGDTVRKADGETGFSTRAQYSIGADARGKDLLSEKEIDLTVYSKVYTPEELCKLAQNYYYTSNDFYPPNAEYKANQDGTYTIRLFEVIADEGGTEHSATCCWYTVNVCGLGRDDILMEDIDINP